MDLSGIEEAVGLAERRWPGIQFKCVGPNEAAGPCPFEHQGTDRFRLFGDGGYWCRQCGKTGWLDDDQQRRALTLAERNAMAIRKLERKQVETDRRLYALELMSQCTDHRKYHQALDDDGRRYWRSQGMTEETIDTYLLGICYSCPTDKQHRMSWTIPVQNHGKLVNIRHRLFTESGDRYRPHMPHLGNTLFLADNLDNGSPNVFICEGEKKALVVQQFGLNCVAIMGQSAFPASWAQRFTQFERVYVMLDPDAKERAFKLAKLFNGRGYVVRLPEKADDFLVSGGTTKELHQFIRLAWRIG